MVADHFSAHAADYAKARQFYEKARELGPSEQLFARILFQIGRCAELSGDWATAANTYQEFVGRYPKDERCVAAHLYWGQSLLAAGQAAQARRVWEDMLTQYQDRPCPETATVGGILRGVREGWDHLSFFRDEAARVARLVEPEPDVSPTE